ncbi:MAG: hypothetical protein AB7K09_14145 [Planctomycetota bacterium]
MLRFTLALLLLPTTLLLLPTPPAAAQDAGDAARQAEDDLESLLRHFGSEHAALKGKIEAAIEKGNAWLIGQQKVEGNWDVYSADARNAIGGTALCALAIKKSTNGLFDGDEKELKKQIRTLERKERVGSMSYTEQLRLKHLREHGADEIKRREAMEKAVEKAMVWIRAEYERINKQMTHKLPDNTQCPPHGTYALGIVLMLLEAYYTEKQQTRDGYVMGVNQRRIPKGDLDWIAEMVGYLERFAVVPSMVKPPPDPADPDKPDPKESVTFVGKAWRYPYGMTDSNVDHSATQYAILGLKAAARMTVHVKDATLWLNVARYLVSVQAPDGPAVPRKPPAVNPGNGEYFFPERYTREQPVDRARGWGYLPISGGENPAPYTGAMTCAALAGLALARSELLAVRALDREPELAAKIERSMADGMAWLGTKFTVTTNPRDPANKVVSWHYYYLYGLERAGVLCRTEFFGDKPWYPTGAAYLCEKQRDDGRWGGDTVDAGAFTDTCFALLFLKRATTPVNAPPIIKPETTGGE